MYGYVIIILINLSNKPDVMKLRVHFVPSQVHATQDICILPLIKVHKQNIHNLNLLRMCSEFVGSLRLISIPK